jgi:4-amino-4-deoxy-L-arabinose transferase-like glycosyltransferase
MLEVETEKYPGWSRFAARLPVFLAAVVYLCSTTNRGVIDYDEGYYAQAALGMAERDDWVTPYANGVRFLEKPPLLYWLTAASLRIFGIREFALRLPTALAVIALVWIVMLTARRLSGERAALIAGLSTAFSAGTYIFTRETLHDVWLVLFIAVAMYAFTGWYLDPLRPARHAMLFYTATAGAALCKSLVGIAFPLGIVFVFFLISRERPKWHTLHAVPGSLLFLVLTVPWHWLAAGRNKGFLDFFFVGEQLLRFFGRRDPPVLWSVPLLTFWALVLVWFFPWTAFLPAAFAESRKGGGPKQRFLARLTVAWAGVILGFFSISNRLEHYAFPALPAFSLLVAATLSSDSESRWKSWAFRSLALLGIAAIVGAACAGIWLAAGQGYPSDAAGPIDRLSETDFSILADLPPVILSRLLRPAAITALSLAIGFLSALWFEKRRRRLTAVMSVAAAMMVVCGMIHWSLVICEDLISSKKFGMAIAREAGSGDRLVVVGDYESANSLSFYQPLKVEIVGGTAYALIPGMRYADAPKITLTRQEFHAAWRSPRRVFALVPKARLDELDPGGIEVLSVLHRQLVRNH